jgi:DNA processing protein
LCTDAWIILNAIPHRNRRVINTLLNVFGSPENVLGSSHSQISKVPGLNNKQAGQIILHAEEFDISLEKYLINKHGLSIFPVTHEKYPANLLQMDNPPPLLYVKGELIDEDCYAVAVIGSRRNTLYGKKACELITRNLATSGISIISGLARGIDTIAHKITLQSSGRTIAVLGNGLAQCYPPENRQLMESISENGAVITEYSMDTSPRKKHFPERNGIIAGMSAGVLVIEATMKSGSLITARAALEENRSVYAVPGNIFKYNYEGTNALIRQGAQPVRSAEDILDDLSLVLKGMMREKNNDKGKK